MHSSLREFALTIQKGMLRPLSAQTETPTQTRLGKSQLGDNISLYRPDKKRAKPTATSIEEQKGHIECTTPKEGAYNNPILPP